jgi:hypothetical protein
VKLRPKNRQKRCYELAWRYLCTDERYNDGSWSLVQGEITSKISGIPLGHAWLISSTGRVYDPVHNEQYSSADYTTKFNAIPQNTYSLKEPSELAPNVVITGLGYGHHAADSSLVLRCASQA